MDWTAFGVSLRLGIATSGMLLPVGSYAPPALAAHEFRGKLWSKRCVTLPLVLPPSVLGYYLLSVIRRLAR